MSIAAIVLQYVGFSKPIYHHMLLRDLHQQGYGPSDYVAEFGRLVSTMGNDTNIGNRSMLIGPNLAGEWTPEQVWATGFVETYASSLTTLAVEKYLIDNCAAQTEMKSLWMPKKWFSNF